MKKTVILLVLLTCSLVNATSEWMMGNSVVIVNGVEEWSLGTSVVAFEPEAAPAEEHTQVIVITTALQWIFILGLVGIFLSWRKSA